MVRVSDINIENDEIIKLIKEKEQIILHEEKEGKTVIYVIDIKKTVVPF